MPYMYNFWWTKDHGYYSIYSMNIALVQRWNRWYNSMTTWNWHKSTTSHMVGLAHAFHGIMKLLRQYHTGTDSIG